jgi:hypothetical protein
MKLVDTQPIDDDNEVQFFKCPMCTKSSQTVTYSKVLPVK